jgi:hypothetical protein
MSQGGILSVAGAIGIPVTPTNGGTGVSNPTAHGVAIAEGSSNFNFIAPTATAGQVLMNQGAALDPAYSTASYPLTTTINQILYSSAADTVTGLATANNGLLVTSSAGVPSILAGSGTTGQILQSNAAAAPSFSTATYPSTSGTAGTILRSDGTNFVNSTTTYPSASGPSGTMLRSNGTNIVNSTATFADTYTASNLLYSNGANTVTGLATANSGVLTTSTTGVPSIDTTNFQVLTTGVQMKGNNANTAPPAGFIGEQIRSAIASGSAVALTSTVAANVTSISLTTGIWDVSCIAMFTGTVTTGTGCSCSINTTSATLGTAGDNFITVPTNSTAARDYAITIPAYRITLGSTTTVYLVARSDFTVGANSVYGRISATRVG